MLKFNVYLATIYTLRISVLEACKALCTRMRNLHVSLAKGVGLVISNSTAIIGFVCLFLQRKRRVALYSLWQQSRKVCKSL